MERKISYQRADGKWQDRTVYDVIDPQPRLNKLTWRLEAYKKVSSDILKLHKNLDENGCIPQNDTDGQYTNAGKHCFNSGDHIEVDFFALRNLLGFFEAAINDIQLLEQIKEFMWPD